MAFGYGKRSKKTMNVFDYIAFALIVVGALNWGLVGIFGFNLVEALTGGFNLAAKIIYGLVGLLGAYGVYTFIKLLIKK